MFSNRIKWDLQANRLSQLIEEKRVNGVQLLDLTESNPTRAGFIYPAEIAGSLSNKSSMIYEPAPRGLKVAREAVKGYYRSRGKEVDPEHIHITASTSEAYAYLFKLLADQGDTILVPQPSYPLFDFLASLEGVNLRHYELHYIHPDGHPGGWRIDFDSLGKSLTANTRAIILVSPNNPTGSFIKSDELSKLNEICSERSIALIVDEVFSDYAFGHDERREGSLAGNREALTFVMSGFSKILALPQMKLGWIVTSGPGRLCTAALERLDLIADTFLSVGAPVQHAAPEWIKMRGYIQEQIIERVTGNLRSLEEISANTPCRLLHSEGGWYAIVEIPRHLSEEEWVLKFLSEDDVLIHPGYFFDLQREAHLIFSLLPKEEIFREAVRRVLGRFK